MDSRRMSGYDRQACARTQHAPSDHFSPQFHVDNLSSAHVYLRLPEGESWEDISKPLLEDCAQLTKANSIEGEDECLEATREWD